MQLNLSAPICSSGYGLVSSEILQALQKERVDVALFIIGPMECQEGFQQAVSMAERKSSFWSRHAPSLRIYHQFSLAQHVGKGAHLGFPIFELDTFTPQEVHHLRSQDLILVATDWARGVLERNQIGVPVEVVPFGVNQQIFHERALPAGSTTTFLHCGKLEYRKGAYDVLDAFGRAFGAKDDVRLVLHVHNPFMRQDVYGKLMREYEGLILRHPLADKIQVTTGRLESQYEVAALMERADCGLFPSRAEGWNLELSEMLSMGRHCIATNYSGHTQFVHGHYCRLIEVDQTESAFDGVYFHGQGRWAKLGAPQVEQFVEHLRAVHQQKQDGTLCVNQLGASCMRELTWGKTARKIKEILQ